MSTNLNSALHDYDDTSYSGSGRIKVLRAYSHIRHRSKRYKIPADKSQLDIEPNWDSKIVIARGELLIKNNPQIAEEWVENKSTHYLTELARRYLLYDYKISPRTARKAVYYALERLVEKEELEGIDPDSESYFKDSTEKGTKGKFRTKLKNSRKRRN